MTGFCESPNVRHSKSSINDDEMTTKLKDSSRRRYLQIGLIDCNLFSGVRTVMHWSTRTQPLLITIGAILLILPSSSLAATSSFDRLLFTSGMRSVRSLQRAFRTNSFSSRRNTLTVAAAIGPNHHLSSSAKKSRDDVERQRNRFLSSESKNFRSVFKDDDDDDMKYTLYERWIRRLYQTNLFHPVKLGLENIDNLHEALGRPMDDVS